MFSSIDILPTLSALTSVELPKNEIDGKNVWNLISGEKDAANPQPYYAFSTNKNLESIMSADGKWKLHLPHNYHELKVPGKDGSSGEYDNLKIELSLFDMENDQYESKNVFKENPEIADKLMAYATSHKEKFYAEAK